MKNQVSGKPPSCVMCPKMYTYATVWKPVHHCLPADCDPVSKKSCKKKKNCAKCWLFSGTYLYTNTFNQKQPAKHFLSIFLIKIQVNSAEPICASLHPGSTAVRHCGSSRLPELQLWVAALLLGEQDDCTHLISHLYYRNILSTCFTRLRAGASLTGICKQRLIW